MNIKAELAAMENMTTGELVERYAALTGQPVRTRHRAYLIRKIAWRLQADAEGDLSERARRRAAELANDADVRLMPPKENPLEAPSEAAIKTVRVDDRDPRLPAVGTMITRTYKGRTLYVVVLADGFEFMGHRYNTLSAVAKAVTGSHVNGFRFFRIGGGQ
ncbi:MAG: hypothetical protein BWX88_04349 [Planctomycetes bacterium ADurb.Bin126]|nr:MAG: hypothetical protein BWX88_04349 [Planctomycetes bacterium ADurb.Bin126]